MLTKGITLRGLEVFEALASNGSVAMAAEATGLSQPAVSQQLRNLETALGSELVDHGKRPMRLTTAGRSFLARTETVLSELRQAQSELSVMDLSHLSTLSVGLIDDFDNELTPRLATLLADSMTQARFKLITAPSRDISAAIQAQELHIAVAASTGELHPHVIEYPLIRDPFIIVAPKHMATSGSDLLKQPGALPLLRYSSEQLISQQIESYLRQQQLTFEQRFEIGSHLALMAMVARGMGWAITTPLGYMRAARFHDQIGALALPGAPFARTISLFAGADWTDTVPRDVARTVQRLVQSHMIDPAVAQHGWLKGAFAVIENG